MSQVKITALNCYRKILSVLLSVKTAWLVMVPAIKLVASLMPVRTTVRMGGMTLEIARINVPVVAALGLSEMGFAILNAITKPVVGMVEIERVFLGDHVMKLVI